MKRTLLLSCLLLGISAVKAQIKIKHADTINIDKNVPIVDEDFTRPKFPGGLKQFYQYLTKNTHYPKTAVKYRIQGKVYLSFIIEKDGSISDVKVTKGLSKDIDAEAVRVLRNSPKWIPGTHDRKPIQYHYSMPMNFELPKKPKIKR
ncbi:MAG TPA: energy transducer TonB [Mucilaginibacter sp.]|nr:energy transducer TonB [Mucilaginibacter sp.]